MIFVLACHTERFCGICRRYATFRKLVAVTRYSILYFYIMFEMLFRLNEHHFYFFVLNLKAHCHCNGPFFTTRWLQIHTAINFQKHAVHFFSFNLIINTIQRMSIKITYEHHKHLSEIRSFFMFLCLCVHIMNLLFKETYRGKKNCQ